PKTKATLELRGWTAAAKGPTSAKLALPVLVVPGAKVLDTRVALQPAPGYRLAGILASGMKRTAAPGEPPRFESSEGNPSLRCEVHPNVPDGHTQATVSVSLRDDRWHVRLSGQWHSFRGGLRDIDVTLDAPAARKATLRAAPDLDIVSVPAAGKWAWRLRP